MLFLVEGSATLTLEGFLRLKSFLKRFLQNVIGSDTPSRVGLAVFGGEAKVQAQVGKFKGDLKGLLKAVQALQPIGGETKTGQALRYVTRHGFVTSPDFADVTDDLPRVVVLITATPSADEVVEPSKYARDREIFLIAVGPDNLKGQLNNITGNPQRTITYSTPEFSGKIPELKAKICSVDTQGTFTFTQRGSMWSLNSVLLTCFYIILLSFLFFRLFGSSRRPGVCTGCLRRRRAR